MAEALTDRIVAEIEPSSARTVVTYDTRVKGFGIRVTPKGAKSFILNYRNRNGRERRLTIGAFPEWKTAAARQEAARLKRDIDVGHDPLEQRERDRSKARMSDLAERFLEYQAPPRLRPSSFEMYESAVRREILPAFGSRPVADISFQDVANLHRKITRRGALYHANRVVSVLSRMFNLSVRWGMREDNPTTGLERNQETKRQRFLSGDELAALVKALDSYPDQSTADIFRLLLLTGARKGEVLGSRWEQFDLERGIWTKPSALTKQKSEHRVPLSRPAIDLLQRLAAAPVRDVEWVFPGRERGRREDIRSAWKKICHLAGFIERRPHEDGRVVYRQTVRIHDLRHTYASILASAGLSLPIIGALLGHTQSATTARYAHLLDDPLREATDHVGSIVFGGG